jgi:LPXTG-motif cell wall-anchored protein
MRWFTSLVALVACILLAAAPALGAERFKMECPSCDHIDADGSGLKPNATLVIVLRDVRTGERLLPNATTVKTDASGSFHSEFPIRLVDHPSVEGSVFNPDGTNLILAAHTQVSAPARCLRSANLPHTGAGSRLLVAVGVVLLGAGAALLRATQPRLRQRNH